jgi:alpha-amylase
VLVDRYFDGDINNDEGVQPGYLARYQGGDWHGLADHLDYVQALGVTTLWISPVVKNVDTDADTDAYHGYWSQDLTQPNPHFGDIGELRRLTAMAHQVGMKVVLDIVANHMGQLFFYDMNLDGHPDQYIGGSGPLPVTYSQSPVTNENEFDPDWDPRGVQAFTSAGPAGRAPIIFIQDPSINRVPPPGLLGTAGAYHGMGRILNYDDVAQRELGDFPGGLKDLATQLPEVRAELINDYAQWVETADFDGFRIDTVKHVEHDFWNEFAGKMRARLSAEGKNNFLMFGEAFDGNDQLLGSYTQPGMLDSVFYFSQHYTVFQQVFEWSNVPGQTQSGTDQIANLWAQKTVNYGTTPQPGGIGIPPSKAHVNFLDNHDVPRFLSDSQGNFDALKNALNLIFAEEGIPELYYGTEQNFAGGNDPSNREVLWTTGFDQTNDTFQHIKKLAHLRSNYVALRRGDTSVLWSTPHTGTEDDAGIFAFERAGGDAGSGYTLVVLNTNSHQPSVTADGGKTMTTTQPGAILVDVLDPLKASYPVAADGTLRLQVPAQKGMILVRQADVLP